MKKLLIIAVVIAMLMTMLTAGFAAENELADSQPTTDTQQNEYTLGDVNGNGEIDSMDYVLLKRAYFGTYNFNEDVKSCADINENGEIDTMDYILLKRAYFGTYDLNKQNDGIEESIEVILPTFEDYDEYVRYLETLTLPDYFVSYEDLSEFGEFNGFVRLSPDAYSHLLYSFVDETGTEFCIYVYCPPQKNPIGTEIFEIEDEQINASDMRNATIVDSKARKYTYQGIEYVYSIHGEISSIRWQCGDIKYVLAGFKPVGSGYPSTDKNTLVNRLLNLETAPKVISNLKSYTLKTNN